MKPEELEKRPKSKKDYRLCYINGNVMYFSPDIEHEWGDDWDDAPADCNAGEPYERNGPCRLLAYEPWDFRKEFTWNQYSVKEIIKYEMVMATSYDEKAELRAGMSMERVERILRQQKTKYGELVDHGKE